jgi:ABC-type dipeptide/oligopeptide/nickel transport system permease subunit
VVGEASLSFVGLGPRDGVSLGALLEQGTLVMLRAPHGLAVAATALAITSGVLQLASASLRSTLRSA